MSNNEEVRHAAVKALHDIMQSVPCSSLYSLAEAVLDAGYAAPVVESQEPVYMVRSHGSDCWEEISGESLELCQCQPEEYETRKLYTSPPAPVAVVLPEPMPITEGMGRLIEAYRIGEFKLEGGSPTVEAMSCASYDNSETAMRDHDFDSYATGYQAAMYEEAKSLLGLIACLDKVKELNQ